MCTGNVLSKSKTSRCSGNWKISLGAPVVILSAGPNQYHIIYLYIYLFIFTMLKDKDQLHISQRTV